MKNFEIMPTEENLITTIEEDILGRNKELIYFYELLLAQSMGKIIAIDGRWGSGKTFFVKQSILMINAMNPRSDMEKEKKDKILNSIGAEENENADLAIYYDAWKNDNDIDPIMSLIYEISMQIGTTYMLEHDIKKNIFETAAAIIECVSGRNVKGIINSLIDDNPLLKFQEQKELDEKIKIFLTGILAERGNRLIIFIDELDRCKPSFAVHLLEQIKHYLYDERIIFVLSVNQEELQYTIKHFYGNEFDASRYLDRFFDLKITLSPADKKKFYNKLELNEDDFLKKIMQQFINNHNMELREVIHFCVDVRAAVYKPIYDNVNFDFSFYDGNARKFMLMCVVPIVIGLRMIDISAYNKFIEGENPKPMVNILSVEEFVDWIISRLLKENESLEKEEGKIQVTVEEKIIDIYNAIFVNKYCGKEYQKTIGKYTFDANAKNFVLSAASMLSRYADYNI